MAAATIEPVAEIKSALEDIQDRRGMSAGITAMQTRRGQFRDDLEMMLTGVAVIPDARRLLNDRLTESWASRSRNPFSDYRDREVIIGAGFSAAVYAATRVGLGFPRPIVLDAAPASGIGGAFTVGNNNPVFYLNSGNRPGTVGSPGNVNSSLNYIPGAPVQPSMLTGREYQTNEEMAFAIRLALMQWADVYPNERVTNVDISGSVSPEVFMEGGLSFFASRVIDLRGLGEPKDADLANGRTILTFPQFMDRMGTNPFPLSGLGRVAVRGSGNSAGCAVEDLLGIGPSTGMSVAGMDFTPEITWYAPGLPGTCQGWRQSERGRYQRIGSYLRRQANPAEDNQVERSTSTRRLRIINERAEAVPTLDGVIVNDASYDTLITCTGNQLPSLTGFSTETIPFYRPGNVNSPVLGRQLGGYFMAGVAADLPFTRNEILAGFDQVAANLVAMFRQVPKISALAASLPAAS